MAEEKGDLKPLIGSQVTYYGRRWYLLMTFSILQVISGFSDNIWHYCRFSAQYTFGWSDKMFLLLVNWLPIVGVLITFPACMAATKKGNPSHVDRGLSVSNSRLRYYMLYVSCAHCHVVGARVSDCDVMRHAHYVSLRNGAGEHLVSTNTEVPCPGNHATVQVSRGSDITCRHGERH